MTFTSAEERYQRDPLFHQLVDVMTAHIEQLQLTPTEIREAAMLASIKFESMHPRPLAFRYCADRAMDILERDIKPWPEPSERTR